MKPFAHARRGQPDDVVPSGDGRAVDQPVALDDPDAGGGEVELALVIHPRLGRLAADQRDARFAADLGGALDEVGDLFEVEAARDVVEQDQRVGAARDHVVDAVRRHVGAAGVQRPAPPGDDGFVPIESVEAASRRRSSSGWSPAKAPKPCAPVDSTAARSRCTTPSAVASETPAAAYVRSSLTLALYEVGRASGQALAVAARVPAGRPMKLTESPTITLVPSRSVSSSSASTAAFAPGSSASSWSPPQHVALLEQLVEPLAGWCTRAGSRRSWR